MKFKIILTWALAVFAGVLLASCGRKTAPIPPQAVIPVPIADLAYQLDEKGVTLSWSPPNQALQGGHLPVINKFLVERAEYEISSFCENCPVSYRQIAVVAGDGIGVHNKDLKTYRDESLHPGHIYFYRVKTSLGWRVVSRSSQPVSFKWQLPMAAPIGLLVQTSVEQEVILSWQPPAGDLEGKPVAEPISFQVYRSISGGNFTPLGSPTTELGFVDQNVENDLDYQYKIKAFKLSGGTGSFSGEVGVTPRDIIPPPSPQGLTVIDTPDGVRLFWDPVVAADLGGYQIFRRLGERGSDDEYKVIGRVLASVSAFIDKTFDQGVCYYAVTAFDLANPANESEFSDEIKMKRKR